MQLGNVLEEVASKHNYLLKSFVFNLLSQISIPSDWKIIFKLSEGKYHWINQGSPEKQNQQDMHVYMYVYTNTYMHA